MEPLEVNIRLIRSETASRRDRSIVKDYEDIGDIGERENGGRLL